jgi:hypothetical protein
MSAEGTIIKLLFDLYFTKYKIFTPLLNFFRSEKLRSLKITIALIDRRSGKQITIKISNKGHKQEEEVR